MNTSALSRTSIASPDSAFEIDLSTGKEGRLWLDEEDGHVVDAIMPVPNHPGYTDFRLRLLDVSDGEMPNGPPFCERTSKDVKASARQIQLVGP